MVGGASRGWATPWPGAGWEGAHVSIASRDEAAIGRPRTVSAATCCAAGGRPFSGRHRAWASATEKQFGGVDLLFTNSGGPPAGAALSFDDRAWQEAVELLLFSALRMAVRRCRRCGRAAAARFSCPRRRR